MLSLDTWWNQKVDSALGVKSHVVTEICVNAAKLEDPKALVQPAISTSKFKEDFLEVASYQSRLDPQYLVFNSLHSGNDGTVLIFNVSNDRTTVTVWTNDAETAKNFVTKLKKAFNSSSIPDTLVASGVS